MTTIGVGVDIMPMPTHTIIGHGVVGTIHTTVGDMDGTTHGDTTDGDGQVIMAGRIHTLDGDMQDIMVGAVIMVGTVLIIITTTTGIGIETMPTCPVEEVITIPIMEQVLLLATTPVGIEPIVVDLMPT